MKVPVPFVDAQNDASRSVDHARQGDGTARAFHVKVHPPFIPARISTRSRPDI
jgi:hypothetical protein